MAWFWYFYLNDTFFEGSTFDGSFEDTIADIWFWNQMGLCDAEFHVGYES